MTEYKINYIVTIHRENKWQDDTLYFEKFAELQTFLRRYTESHSNEEYTVTIYSTKGAEQ